MLNLFSRFHRLLAILGSVFFISSSNVASAQDDLSVLHYVPNFLSLDYSKDNDHGKAFFLYANLGITTEDRLLLGIGKQDETVTGSEENLDNKTFLLGYNYMPHYRSQIGAEYERWGDSSKVDIDSLRIVLAFNTGDFAVTVTPEYRKINVNNSSSCDETIESGSARIDLSIDLSSEYSLNAGYVSYDYNNNLTEMANCVSNSEQLSVESRIDSVANDREVSIGLDYYIDSETYGGSFLQAKTALNNLSYRSLSFFASTDKFDDWTLRISSSISKNTDDSSTITVSGSITYYW